MVVRLSTWRQTDTAAAAAAAAGTAAAGRVCYDLETFTFQCMPATAGQTLCSGLEGSTAKPLPRHITTVQGQHTSDDPNTTKHK
jgi:hypothetical protein